MRATALCTLVAAVASPLLLAGCGYALVGRASNLPADIESVYIAPFVNRTQRSQVDQVLTQALAAELVTRRRFSVLSNPEGADAELAGEVLTFGLTPVSFDPDGRATEYEISITAAVALTRIGEDEPVWSNDRYLFRENYPIEDAGTDYLDRENQAIEDAADRFAETMVSDLLEGF